MSELSTLLLWHEAAAGRMTDGGWRMADRQTNATGVVSQWLRELSLGGGGGLTMVDHEVRS